MNAETILQILEHTSAYVIVLDAEMRIRYINLALANRLGFETSKELLDRCWLDFISDELQEKIKTIHRALLTSFKSEYNEFINEVVSKDGKAVNIRWVNTAINHTTNWTFSIGIPEIATLADKSADELRSHFKATIKSDRTMIESLKAHIKGNIQTADLPDTCDLTSE